MLLGERLPVLTVLQELQGKSKSLTYCDCLLLAILTVSCRVDEQNKMLERVNAKVSQTRSLIRRRMKADSSHRAPKSMTRYTFSSLATSRLRASLFSNSRLDCYEQSKARSFPLILTSNVASIPGANGIPFNLASWGMIT